MLSREEFQTRAGQGDELSAVRIVVPDHALIRVIGRGAYGDVWLARHTTLGVFRAIKVVHRSTFDDPRPFERELDGIRRYEPLSRAHPHLVSILQVGVTQDAFFYIMDLADSCPAGGSPDSENYIPASLRNVLKKHGRFTAKETVDLGYELAAALAYLHDHQLVHRDVKPSNIIFVSGAVKLADIGLITRIDEARSFVGTVGYIPLEGPGTFSADCYSLGKVLYELVTGNDRLSWPEPCNDLHERSDRASILELNVILHRACSHNPTLRYRHGREMLADFDYLRKGASIGKHYARLRLRKWLGMAALFSLVMALLIGLLRSKSAEKDFSHRLPSRKRSANSEANDLYDVGHAIYLRNTPKDMEVAASKLEAAIQKDPTFALAHGALAATWCWESVGTNSHFMFLEKAKSMADRALALDEAVGDAHLALAWHAFVNARNWAKADREFRRAIELDPGQSQPHQWYGLFLRSLGRTTEAVKQLETAVDIEPSSSVANWFLAGIYFNARRYSDAISKYHKAMDAGATYQRRFHLLAEVYYFQGNLEEYFTANQQHSIEMGMEIPKAKQTWDRYKQIYLTKSPQEYFRSRIQDLMESGQQDADLAELFAYAGLKESMYQSLESRDPNDNFMLVWDILTHPVWDAYRSEPRFRAVLQSWKLDDESIRLPYRGGP